MAIIFWVLIGIITGWLAALLFSPRGGGLPIDLALGLGGAVVGGFLFTYLSPAIRPNFIVSLGAALIGAIIVLLVCRVIRRA